MNKNKENKTLIIVSHRRNALVNCDKIYILKDSKITSNISYEELINKTDN